MSPPCASAAGDEARKRTRAEDSSKEGVGDDGFMVEAKKISIDEPISRSA